MARCSSRAPATRPPEGMPLPVVRTHPRWLHTLELTARCELASRHGHDTGVGDPARRHMNGGLAWWDPPLLIVGGSPYEPDLEPGAAVYATSEADPALNPWADL